MAKRIDTLRDILSHLPESVQEQRIALIPNIGPAIQELWLMGFIFLNIRALRGNGAGKAEFPSLDDEETRKQGIEIRVSRDKSGCTKWQWELIKRSLVKIGFKHSGAGQSDWYLYLLSSNTD